jgi:hypothetical protein
MLPDGHGFVLSIHSYFVGHYKNGTFNCYKEIEYDRGTAKKAKELVLKIFKEIK